MLHTVLLHTNPTELTAGSKRPAAAAGPRPARGMAGAVSRMKTDGRNPAWKPAAASPPEAKRPHSGGQAKRPAAAASPPEDGPKAKREAREGGKLAAPSAETSAAEWHQKFLRKHGSRPHRRMRPKLRRVCEKSVAVAPRSNTRSATLRYHI
jgi:hypothetical protein